MGSMIDHITLTVSNLRRAVEFYGQSLAPLGYVPGYADDHVASFQVPTAGDGPDEGGELWIKATDKPLNPIHVAFRAGDADQVKAFYEAGLKAGGTDNGAPGPRNYHPGYYAAFIHDPDGNNIEAMLNDYQG